MGLRADVLTFIQKHKLLSSGDRVLVAVSGGPDSVALLHLLYDLRDELALHLEVAHLQHGMRGEEANEDARFVANLANNLGLPFHLKEVDLPKIKSSAGKGNLEALARAERYAFFAALARERNLGKIATAHTQDDQAETVLMWLLRGAGLKGLGGMSPMLPFDVDKIEPDLRPAVVRPLLDTSRADIEAYLSERRLKFRLDSTNRDPSFLRNWIRLELMPQLKAKTDRRLPSRLAQQAELMRDEESFLQERARIALEEIRTSQGMDRETLLQYSKALQRRLLRLWIEEQRGHLRGLDFRHVDEVLALIEAKTPQGRLSLPGGLELVKEYNTLRLEHRSRGFRERYPCYHYELRVGEDLCIQEAGLMIQAREIPAPLQRPPAELMEAVFDFSDGFPALTVRNFRRGDRFRPLGMAGHKKVKELFIEKKVPLSIRACLPLLVLDHEVVWIPGYARSDVRKVTAESRTILQLKAIPIPHRVC